MFGETITLGARDWLWPACALFGMGLLFVSWSYFKARAFSPAHLAGAALKLLGFAILALCLVEPMKIAPRPREGANLFALLADNSQGLQIKDKGQSVNRSEILRNSLLSAQEGWQEKLARTFQVRRYIFDNRLRPSENFGDLQFDGSSSAMGTSLKMIQERFQGQPLAGILLFTDGNATDPSALAKINPSPPIYPVLIGSTEGLQDVAIHHVSVAQTAFEDAPVTILVEVTSHGFTGPPILAEIFTYPEGTGQAKSVARQTQPARDGKITFRFQIKPEKPGLSFYTAKVNLATETQSLEEGTLHNNSRVVAVDRGRGPYRILYVGGRPNWEYKFLNRAISEDPQLQLPALMRIARREPKFSFRGRSGESSNPLFRGFNKTTEETERYDQPVLVRLNTRDENELRGGFPKTPEALFEYHAVILDDLEAAFFTPDQLMLMQRFVADRGGGFLMLGGVDSLEDGNYARNPIGEMLPVYLDRGTALPPATELRLDLSREGWLQPWMRLRSTESEERDRLSAVPPYQVVNTLKDIKPGASLLATATDISGAIFPAFAIQRFGHGRTGCITLGDLWRGGLSSEKMQEDLGKAWRQIARWLTGDVPEQVELRVTPTAEGESSAVRLVLKVKDKRFEPMDNAEITLKIQPPQGGAVKLETESSTSDLGTYHGDFVPRAAGPYRASASVYHLDGTRIGEVETGWAADPLADEFKSLVPNRPLMEALARQTGGKVITLEELDQFVATLSSIKAPVMETYSYPLWNKSSVFLLALLCFISEWGLRRWKGLA